MCSQSSTGLMKGEGTTEYRNLSYSGQVQVSGEFQGINVVI